MPLRPVSELGLVDITDVPAREGNRTATPSRSTPASTRTKPGAGHRAAKSPAGAPKPSAVGNSGRSGAAKRPEPSQSRGASTAKPGSRAPAIAKNSGGNSNRSKSSTASTRSSERSRSQAKPARDAGSGRGTRSGTAGSPKRPNGSASRTRGTTTARRQTSAASRTERNAVSPDKPRSRSGSRHNQTKAPSAAKIGVLALAGASLVAGGVLFVRAALHR